MSEVNFPVVSNLGLEDDGHRGMSLQAAVALTTAVIAKSDSITQADHAAIRTFFRNIAADAMRIMAPK